MVALSASMFLWILFLLSLHCGYAVQDVCIRSLYHSPDCVHLSRSPSCKAVMEYGKEHQYLRAKGRILLTHVFNSVGNTLGHIMMALQFAIHNNLALVIGFQQFTSMRVMLEPNLFDFDQRHSDQDLASYETHHIARYSNGSVISIPKSEMSAGQFSNITSCQEEKCKVHLRGWLSEIYGVQYKIDRTCNPLRFLFRMTPFAEMRHDHMMSMLGLVSKEYVVWHIRTSNGDFGYNRTAHTHVIHEENEDVCRVFLSVHENIKAGKLPVYLSTNGPNMKHKCGQMASSNALPMELKSFDFHLHGATYHTRGEGTGLHATDIGQASFLDFIMLTKAKVILNSGSSFSSMAVEVNGMTCAHGATFMDGRSIYYCQHPSIEQNSLAQSAHTTRSDSLDLTDNVSYQSLFAFPVAPSQSCSELVWCNASRVVQKFIYDHQNPASCEDKKFLYFEPQNYGIGSMIHIAGAALSMALCANRILYMPISKSRYSLWRSAGCSRSSLLCYFQPITKCTLDEESVDKWPIMNHTTWEHADVVNAKVVRVGIQSQDLPSGPCSFCSAPSRFPFPSEVSPKVKDMFVGAESPLMAQMVRYILRPQEWFLRSVQQFALAHMSTHSIPRPFASVHVRYGDKYLEAPRQPLDQYMNYLRLKHPAIRYVFLSTETESVIAELRHNYPQYVFMTMNYSRIEANNPGTLMGTNYAQEEFTASFANLFVAIQADAFVGSLSSNWCRLIHELERTRGDAGEVYHSVDGSQYSRCFGRK